MSVWEDVKKSLNEGLVVSKKLLSGAGQKTKELKDSSIIRLELHDLQSKRNKSYAALGKLVCSLFAEQKRQSVTRTTAGVKEALEEVTAFDKKIAEKERALKTSQT